MNAAGRAEGVPNADSVLRELAVGASVEVMPRQLPAPDALARLLPRDARPLRRVAATSDGGKRTDGLWRADALSGKRTATEPLSK